MIILHFDRLRLWDLSWDLKKTISWEMGLGPPLHDPQFSSARQEQLRLKTIFSTAVRHGKVCRAK